MVFQLEECPLCSEAQIVHWLAFHLLKWLKKMNAHMTVVAISLLEEMRKYAGKFVLIWIVLNDCLF